MDWKIKRISHIAAYGRELEPLKHLCSDILGMTASHEETYKGRSNICFYPVGDTEIELVAPLEKGNAFDKVVDKEGTGINHIAFEVEGIDAAAAELKEKGYIALEAEVTTGAQGSRIIFLDKSRTENISIELVESAT